MGIANELVNLGVSKEDIVLAVHEPLLRPYPIQGLQSVNFLDTNAATEPLT